MTFLKLNTYYEFVNGIGCICDHHIPAFPAANSACSTHNINAFSEVGNIRNLILKYKPKIFNVQYIGSNILEINCRISISDGKAGHPYIKLLCTDAYHAPGRAGPTTVGSIIPPANHL